MKPVIIKSYLLSQFSEIVHGISTKIGSVNDFNFNLGNFSNQQNDIKEKNRKIFFDALNIDLKRVVYQQQVHSNKFTLVNEPKLEKENDALITTQKNLFLVVTIADCIPILFYDRTNQIIGVVHAGWRGTYSKILLSTIEFAITEMKLSINDTFFYFGPSICSNCFEVDEDVAQLFDSKFVKKKEKKFTVDLPQVNLNYLMKLGFNPSNVHISRLCTFECSSLLHSYRRDKENSGRMIGVIGIR
ncbi:MAG: peptidoglycan editing factor PgeF [Ignavibacteria bacterium]|nr:peptidoglycan editing factor PgeF [Ignavibacteria bacterium]